MTEFEKLKHRITNLEMALHGMWVLLKNLQPPATQTDIDNMLSKHFDASSELGGFGHSHKD